MGFTAINVAELWELQKDPCVYIIDLRSRREYALFHLKGAYNYSYDQMECWKENLPKNRKILLCCEYGNTSMRAARQLAQCGYSVYTLIGGLNALNG